MNKFIMGMIVATAIILLYIYRKKIFVAAQDGNTSGNGNKLITVPTSTAKAVPGTDGAMLGKMIADMMSIKASEDSPVPTNDVTYKPTKPGWKNPPSFDIGKMTINRAIEYPKASFCNCGNPIESNCGCSQTYDYQ